MDSLYFDLKMILEKQSRVVAGMVEATREHNQALQDNDPAAIMAAVARLEELSRALQELDQEREIRQGRLVQQHGLPNNAALKQLLPHVPVPALVKDLEQLAAGLQQNLTQLAEINQLNHMLAQRGLAFTGQLMRIINPGCDTYAGSGELKNEEKNRSAFSIIDKTI